MRAGYPAVQPLILDDTPAAIMQRVETIIADQPDWVVTHRDAETLEGEVTTSVFRFVDDFVFVRSYQRVHFCPSLSALRDQSLSLIEQAAYSHLFQMVLDMKAPWFLQLYISRAYFSFVGAILPMLSNWIG